MNSIFYRLQNQENGRAARPVIVRLAIFVAIVMFGVTPASWPAQAGAGDAAEFKRSAAELSAARLGGGEENQAQMEKALRYLDTVVLAMLNGSAEANLEGANRGLAALVSHNPPVGENYRLVKLGGNPAVYALLVNFGQGGPAAVRIYAGPAGHYALGAKIDHFTQKDFFDSDVELVSASNSDPVFVTISGRTDDLSTGLFSAWRFDGHGVAALWSSDLVQQSSYEADPDGFRLAYCSKVDEDHPSECLKMSRDLYRFQGGEWKRVESADLPSPKPAAK
jgi:hypothetical protein